MNLDKLYFSTSATLWQTPISKRETEAASRDRIKAVTFEPYTITFLRCRFTLLTDDLLIYVHATS